MFNYISIKYFYPTMLVSFMNHCVCPWVFVSVDGRIGIGFDCQCVVAMMENLMVRNWFLLLPPINGVMMGWLWIR